MSKRGREEFPIRDILYDKRARLTVPETRIRQREETNEPEEHNSTKRQRRKKPVFSYVQPAAEPVQGYQGIMRVPTHKFTEVDVDFPAGTVVKSRKSKRKNETRVAIKTPEMSHSNIKTAIRDAEGRAPNSEPSEWQKIVKEYRKQGFSMAECSQIYRNGRV